MKSEKGITLMALMLYVVVILIALTILASISTYFYTNVEYINDTGQYMIEYNKFNMYFIEDVKANTKLFSIFPEELVFGDGTTYTFINKGVYRNHVKICDNIYDLGFYAETVEDENGFAKIVIHVDMAIVGSDVFEAEDIYVLNYWDRDPNYVVPDYYYMGAKETPTPAGPAE